MRAREFLFTAYVIGVGLSASASASGATEKGPGLEPPAAMEREEITDGFFFWRGTYVSPPYVVTLDADGIKINGICVRHWPSVPKGTPIPTEDPGEFNWTEELRRKGLEESGFTQHASIRFYYWERTQGWEKACELYEAYFSAQPSVKKVERWEMGDFGLRYWTQDDHMMGISFSRPRTPAEEEERRISVQKDYEEETEGMRRNLKRGSALIFLRGYISIPPGPRLVMLLQPLCETAGATIPKEEKIAKLQKMGPIFAKDEIEILLAGFENSATLMARVAELREEFPEAR